MIAGLKPYASYRDSGVPWLKAVPNHWRAAFLRRYCKVFAGATPSRSEPSYWARGTIPWLSSGDVNSRRIREARQFISEAGHESSSTRWIRPRSIVLALAGQGKTKGMVATVEFPTTCNQSLAAIEPSEGDSKHDYLAYYLESRYRDIRALVGDGLRDGLNLEHVKSIRAPLPPLPEQDAIIQFLDHADRRIRRYLLAKQKLIAALEELKRAVIHRAVTGQIDVRTGTPYPTYKDSGAAELGRIPEHWNIVRLGKLIALQTGFPFKSEGFTQNAEDPRLLRGVNIAPGRLRWEDTVRWPATEADTAPLCEYRLETGDIVLGMDRPVIRGGIRVAVVTDADVPSLLLQRVARIRPGPQFRRDFAFLLLGGKRFADYMAPIFTGISVPHLSPEQIKAFTVALPGLGEQDQILEALASETLAAQRAANRAARQIEQMKEYRTRLIADVVTGKLDVREAAAALSDAAPA